jgi:hypothetical protein
MSVPKKLTIIGNSRGIIIPADWIQEWEKRVGHPIETLLMDYDKDSITLRPELPDVSKDQLPLISQREG